MEKLKEYKYIILITLVVLGFAFYWFQFRPTSIRKECAKNSQSTYGQILDGKYEDCLRNNGLK